MKYKVHYLFSPQIAEWRGGGGCNLSFNDLELCRPERNGLLADSQTSHSEYACRKASSKCINFKPGHVFEM